MAVRLSVGRSMGQQAPTGCGPWRKWSASGAGPWEQPWHSHSAASEGLGSTNASLETDSKPPPALFICLRDLLSALCSGGVIDAPYMSVCSERLCSATNITKPFLFPVGPSPPGEFSPISHLMNTGGGRGGPFVRDKQPGTRLHLSVGGGDTF